MEKIRGFEKCKGYEEVAVMPVRKTAKSAGYDICVPNVDKCQYVPPHGTLAIKTGIKAYMQDDEVLELHIRSSVGIKKGIILSNATGIIDSDFFNNVDNEGNITLALRNMTETGYTFKPGEAVCQGIFKKYLIVDNDNATAERTGGIGSTDK